MPRVDEILDALAAAVFLPKVDLQKGFHQIPIAEKDREKTAFCFHSGKFHISRMPFGLRNGPAVFQRLIDNVLVTAASYTQVYIDDNSIYSGDWMTHRQHIVTVLSLLHKAGLTANIKKCYWGMGVYEFLGHVVGSGMVTPSATKLQTVAAFPQHNCKKDVRKFLGLSWYYRKVIPKYANNSLHLTDALKKDAPKKLSRMEELEREFQYLKNHLCRIPALTLPLPDDDYICSDTSTT